MINKIKEIIKKVFRHLDNKNDFETVLINPDK